MSAGAFIFVPALVGAVVFGFAFLLFVCNYFLTVLESTAAGGREVTWVSEPVIDNAWKLAYLGFLFSLWLGPAILIGRTMSAGSASWLTVAAPLAVLWLCYPVSQLSSLSAHSIWIPLVPDVFARMLQKPGIVLTYYALSAATVAVLGLAIEWAFCTKGEWELLFVGAPLMVVAALFYARLLGRLAFALRFTTGLFATKRRRKQKPERETQSEQLPPPVQPEELPPLLSPEGELVGYNLLLGDDPPASPKKRIRAEIADRGPPPLPGMERNLESRPPQRHATKGQAEGSRLIEDEDDEEPAPYGMKEPEALPRENTPQEVIAPLAVEMALLNRDDAPKPPARVWGPDLFAFLPQPGTVSAILIASSLCFAATALVRIAREFNPAAGTP